MRVTVRPRRQIEGDVGAETLADEHDARAIMRGDRREPMSDAVKQEPCQLLGLAGLGEGEGGWHEGVLRNHDRAVTAGEVFECLGYRVVEVADTRW